MGGVGRRLNRAQPVLGFPGKKPSSGSSERCSSSGQVHQLPESFRWHQGPVSPTSIHTRVDTDDHSHNQSHRLGRASPVPGPGLSCTSSLCPDNIGTRAQVVAVQVSLFKKNIFLENLESIESTTPLPQSLEGKQDANSEVHGSWTPGQGERWPLHPREGQPPGTQKALLQRGALKRRHSQSSKAELGSDVKV